MKIKSLIALLFVLCLGYNASAQMYGGSTSSSSVGAAPSVGVRVGVTFASLNMDGDGASFESDNLTGFQIGAIYHYPISEIFAFQPEVLLVQKGGTFGSDDQSVDFRFNYLEAPILGKFSFGNGPVTGFVTAGPTLGYWLGGQFDDQDIEFDDTDNRFEFGASIGAGAAFNLPSGALNLDVRYGAGLTSLSDSEDGTIKNRVISVSLGYIFGN